MGDITQDLVISGGGSTTVATDDMLADLQSMTAISAALGAMRSQLAIADATLGDTARAMTQVGWARASMDDAWIAMSTAKDIVDYVGDGLVIAIDNYTETERNVTAIASWIDPVYAFLFGKSLSFTMDVIGPLTTFFPWMAQLFFGGQKDAIGAQDISIWGPFNAWVTDPANVLLVRGLITNGELFAAGLEGAPTLTAEQLRDMGFSGAALSSALLMSYLQMAGMLDESGVKVEKSASYHREGPAVSSTEDRAGAIPDAQRRPDGAQIRIDKIVDGDSVRYEVFIAGTADFNPIAKTEPFDTTSNVAGVAGQTPASYRAVELAMEQAGITAESEVSFSGHSQGGLIASMLAASGDWNTKGLTIFGSPSGQIIIPPGVDALIVEHYEDMVPALGGTQQNTDATIVSRHAFSDEYAPDLDSPMPAHQIDSYLETAVMIDNAESAKLQDTLASLNDFSSGDSVTSTWFTAERIN